MKRSELDELEGRRQEKSWKIGADAFTSAKKEDNADVMDSNLTAIVSKLTAPQQARAKMLWDELVDLHIKPGLRNRLMGMGHMGALNDPIWRYIYKLRTGAAKAVRDKGSWLIKCLINNRLVQ